MEKINNNEITKGTDMLKGTEFWKNEIKQSGLLDALLFFNDVITERRPPHIDANYGEPLLTDVVLDGKKTDVYHTDWNGGSWHRIFIHLKE
jgi:hypothetical protein